MKQFYPQGCYMNDGIETEECAVINSELENAMETWTVTEFERGQEFRDGCSICGEVELCSSGLGTSARASAMYSM